MEFKDYYKIMGVAPEAGADEIKRAYRKLARKYHPDVSDDPNAEDRFKEVGEAYEVLKDPAKREEYDQLRKGGWQGGQEFRPPPGCEARPRPGQRFREDARVWRIRAVAEAYPAGRYLTCFAEEEVAP